MPTHPDAVQNSSESFSFKGEPSHPKETGHNGNGKPRIRANAETSPYEHGNGNGEQESQPKSSAPENGQRASKEERTSQPQPPKHSSHPDAAENSPSESFSFKKESKHPNEDSKGGPKPPEPAKPNPPPAQEPHTPQEPQHKSEFEREQEHRNSEPEPSPGMDKRGHTDGEHGFQPRLPYRQEGGPIRAEGGGPFSTTFNIASDAVRTTRHLLADHRLQRSANMSQKAANHGHIADIHHSMANEYESKGNEQLAKEARRRGDIEMAHHDKALKIASKNFNRLPKHTQHNEGDALRDSYNSTRSIHDGQGRAAKELASRHADHVAGHVTTDPNERAQNRALKNHVMSNVLSRHNATKAHDNFEGTRHRVTPFANLRRHTGAKGTTNTLRWGSPNGVRRNDLTYAPSKEPGFVKPRISGDLAF